MMKTKAFQGTNVFMSRNLVPPEVFDKLLGALRDNGAEVFLCCDPSRNGPNDLHIISSIDHEKFEDLRAKGCNLIGPQCVLSCAKENRALPKRGFTCCLAMDGLKVLTSGFDADEKVKIERLVVSMGGVLHNKASFDVSFIIVKNVLAAKYKWALNNLKKPIVTINWLYQCWSEHRVVPQESYRVPPFSGLTICVSRIPADERKEIEKLVIQNGGKYSAELTKKCTHLICDVPEGDKYKVARRWGHVHIVTRKWFDQSLIRRACLNEESYPVQNGCVASSKIVTGSSMMHKEEKQTRTALSLSCSAVNESCFPMASSSGFKDIDLEATVSENMSSMPSDSHNLKIEDSGEAPELQPTDRMKLDGCVANDSQSEDNDLYLSDCRILLVGFEVCEMRKLVSMVRRGGASRYMSFNDKLTHIVVGALSEIEKKEVKSLAASGVIQVVRTTWIEDCDSQKKEIPVQQRHVALDLLLPKDSVPSKMAMLGSSQSKNSVLVDSRCGKPLPLTKFQGNEAKSNVNRDSFSRATVEPLEMWHRPFVNDAKNSQQKKQHDFIFQNSKDRKTSNLFEGKIFSFSESFPEDRRPEIVEWVDQGGGEVVDDVKQNVHFIIHCHGVTHGSAINAESTIVSTHWVRSCLEDGHLLDVSSHILYSPLPCRVPLPGFENFRLCVSQYEGKDRLLLRNLCFVLGAKFNEKLTKKVTHLLCKFTSGPKYETACKWGIRSVMLEWIYECVRQNKVVSVDPFFPKDATAEDREAGLCTVSQFPTQAHCILSTDNSSDLSSQSQTLRNPPTQTLAGKNELTASNGYSNLREEAIGSNSCSKKAKLLEYDEKKSLPSFLVDLDNQVWNRNCTEDSKPKDTIEVAHVPDVAAAIEDLLEQTSKIHDQKSPESSGCDKSIFSSDCTGLHKDSTNSHSLIGLSRHWLNRTMKKDEIHSSGDVNASLYDGFSETQTESQVVGYEEDLSGRQMLIDRVRTRGSLA